MSNPTVEEIIISKLKGGCSIPLTPREIVKDYLEDNDYTGLCLPEEECGCPIGDLYAGLGCPRLECQAGYDRNDAVYLEKEEVK